MLKDQDPMRFMDSHNTCPICSKLGVYWMYFQDPGFEDEGLPFPEEVKQFEVIEGPNNKVEGTWIKRCPICGKKYRYHKSLQYCIHYCQEFESYEQLEYLMMKERVQKSDSSKIPNALMELSHGFSKEHMILYLKAMINLNMQVPDIREPALNFLVQLDRVESIKVMIEQLSDTYYKWRCYICEMLSIHGDESAVEPIRKLLNDENEEVSNQAVKTLEKIYNLKV